MSAKHPVLELNGVSKSFGAVQALKNVDFKAWAGQVTALVGDNGAGKTTLIKGVAGIYPFDKGTIYFDGRPARIANPRDSAALGIEVVYQDLSLVDNLDVVANVFLGRERVNRFYNLDELDMEQVCLNLLGSLAVTTLHSVRQAVVGLSHGQRQAVAVARAIMSDSRLVIFDEPTASLGIAQACQVLELVRRLANKGMAVILISHNLHEVFEVSDRITVLRLGQKVTDFDTTSSSRQEVVRAITASKNSHIYPTVADL